MDLMVCAGVVGFVAGFIIAVVGFIVGNYCDRD
jgi:hypothetical protein